MEWCESNLTEKKTKEPKEKIKRMILNIYDSQKQISKAEINQLKELLGEIPNLVINFDETITQ